MRSAGQLLRRAAARLLGRGEVQDAYVPDFAAVARLGNAQSDLFDCWVQTKRPAFFMAPAAVPQWLAEMPAPWKQRMLAAARDEREVGLKLYSRTVATLDADFPWSNLDGGSHDDNLYKIRPHRFAFLARQVLAVLEGQLQAASLDAIVAGWQRAAASIEGARRAYSSNLLVIQRLCALLWALALLEHRGTDPAVRSLSTRLLCVLGADVAYLRPRLGDSAPNNHLLADRFAEWLLPMVATPLYPGSNADAAERAWLAELERQTYPDGTGFEHSSHYHEIGCEMALAYLRLSELARRTVPRSARERIGAMLSFQAQLCGAAGMPKRIGSGVEDALFGLGADDGESAAALRECCRAQFEPSLAAVDRDAPGVEKAWFLCGGKLAESASKPPSIESRSWPDGGYALLHAGRHRLWLRSGPHPNLRSFSGHAHADLLSIHIDHDGTPLVEDAGTCTYRLRGTDDGSMPLRAHFEGPWAHSGPLIECEHPFGPMTQAFRAGDLAARASLIELEVADAIGFEARVRGGGVYAGWRRWVIAIDAGWLVVDLSPQPAAATVGVQLSPGARVSLEPGGHRASIAFDALDERLHMVAAQPLLDHEGAVSRRYGERTSAPRLTAAITPQGLAAVAFGPAEWPAQAVHASREANAVRVELVADSGSRRIALPID